MEGQFLPHETLGDLTQFFRSHLVDAEAFKWDLIVTPPRVLYFLDLSCVLCALVYFYLFIYSFDFLLVIFDFCYYFVYILIFNSSLCALVVAGSLVRPHVRLRHVAQRAVAPRRHRHTQQHRL